MRGRGIVRIAGMGAKLISVKKTGRRPKATPEERMRDKEILAGASLPASLLPITSSMRRMGTRFPPQDFLIYSTPIILYLSLFVKDFFVPERFIPCGISNMPKG